MSISFSEKLREQLKINSKFVDEEGNLLENNIINSTLTDDNDLFDILIDDPEIRNHFFYAKDNIFIFKKEEFLDYIFEKNIFDNSYTKFRNKIGLNVGNKFLNERNEVSLVFPFKDCVLAGGMDKEDAGRDEIFFNEILAKDEIDKLFDKKVFNRFEKFTSKGSTKDFNFNKSDNLIKDNLILKGNNLLVLHSLKSVFGKKVKLIYIDPPFNTNNDSFKYNDRFNHSSWLTFMKNRLEVAKELLTDDGIIFVELDYHEEAYLKVLMDEIFGRDNYVNTISMKVSSPSGQKTAHRDKTIIETQDFILVYAKNKKLIKFKPQYVKKYEWDTHYNTFIEKTENGYETVRLVDKLKDEGIFNEDNKLSDFDIDNRVHKKFYKENGDYIVRHSTHTNKKIKKICNNEFKDKVYEYENNFYLNNNMLQPISKSFQNVLNGKIIENDISNVLCDRWDDIDFQNTQNQGGVDFPKGKKPEQLLYRIIDMTTNEGDIVLDFFLGSGTTCAVAHKMNRQYIGIEQLDYEDNSALVRLQKVIGEWNGVATIDYDKRGMSESLNWQGGGEFIYCELEEYNQEAINILSAAKNTEELINLWNQLTEKYFLKYDVEVNEFDENLDSFKELDLIQQKEILFDMLNKNHLYVNYSEIEDAQFNIDDNIKQMNKEFYSDYYEF